jgi:hypothetical protein
MAIVNQVSKIVKMDHWNIVKYQIATHCYLKDIQISKPDLSCLTFLALSGERELPEFCTLAAEHGIFKTSQSVRNALAKAAKKKLITKDGKNKKKIKIAEELNVQINGNILLIHKLVYISDEKK